MNRPHSQAAAESSGDNQLVPPLDNLSLSQREHIPVSVFPDADDACREVAQQIANCIRDRMAAGKQSVLGLANDQMLKPVPIIRYLVILSIMSATALGALQGCLSHTPCC